jgi:RNA polymerase sigma-70 factor (sigma-E family)
MGHVEEFTSFARERSHALLRSAYLLTGDQHLAEDLVQASLARTYLAWRRIDGPGNVEAYARRVMYHQQVSWWRRRRAAEWLTADPPEPRGPGTDTSDGTDVRLMLRDALRKLPPKQRVVLILRFFEDYTEAEAAAVLDVRIGTIKSQTARGLARMRAIAPELAHLYGKEEPGMTGIKGARG